MRLSTDNWEARRQTVSRSDAEDWHEVEAAIRTLDQQRRTSVILGDRDGPQLIIGGGAGRYVVSIAWPDDEAVTLTRPVTRPGSVTLVAGGSEGVFREHEVVNLEAALAAARYFFDQRAPAPDLAWR